MRPTKYVVKLTDDQVQFAEKILRDSKSSQTVKTRAQIVLDADINHGKTYSNIEIGKMNRVNPTTVSFIARELTNTSLAETLKYKHSEASKHGRQKLSGADEARLIQIACSEAPEGYTRWSLSLLEKQVACDANFAEKVKRDAIGRILKKTNLSLTKPSTGPSHQNKMPNS